MSDADAERSNRLRPSARIPETAEIGGAVTAPPDAPTYSARPQALAPLRIKGLVWIVCAIILVLWGSVVAAMHLASSSTKATPLADRAYAGYTAAFALATLAAATLALLISIPPFFNWINDRVRRVKVQIWFEVAHDSHSSAEEVTNGEFELSGREFVLRVAVSNVGAAMLPTRLNIFVPAQCTIEVLDDPRVRHTIGVLPVDSSYIDVVTPDDPPLWNYSVSTFTMESHTTLYRHLQVKAPEAGTYPMFTRIPAVAKSWVRVNIKMQ